MTDPARVPVIAGVGEVEDRTPDQAQGQDSLSLMSAALGAAAADCGGRVLDRLDWLGVVDQLSFPDPDIHHHLADGLDHMPSQVLRTRDASGDEPVRLLNDAANLIAAGELHVAAVVGAEAMRTANKRMQAAGREAADKLAEAATAGALPHARPYGLLTPAEIYPLYEQATRAAWGQSLVDAQAETGLLWAALAEVAAANPHAWLREPVAAAHIITPSANNRPISFPYTKLMVANNAVNQGAAVIVTSLALAQELEIPEDRLIYIGRGAAAHEPDDYLRRDSFARSASMTAVHEHVLDLNDLAIAQIDDVELYSCFPCIPKMARRVLGWPVERPVTVYGGLTFGGAPVGNCMSHAVAAMVRRMRSSQRTGLVFANGGYASHNHAIVLARAPRPDADRARSYDVQSRAEAERGPVPQLLERHVGAGTIESYVMPYDRRGTPRFATIVARTARDERFLAHVPPDDAALLGFLAGENGEPVGTTGVAVPMDDGRVRWSR